MKNYIFLFCVCCSIVLSQKLNVAFGAGKPPYVLDENEKGIEVDIVKMIFNGLRKEIRISFLPFDYLQTSVLKKRADIAVGVSIQDDGLFYSDGLTMYKNAAIVKKKLDVTLNTFEDFKNLRVGSWKNASKNLGVSFNKSVKKKTYKYYEYPDQKDQNIAFWKNSIDIIIVDISIFEWFKKKVGVQNEAYVVFPLFEPKYTYVSFSDKNLRDLFNSELRKLKMSGKYDRIIQSYLN